MPRRNRPTLTEQLAAALLALGHIPFEHAREMTAKQIIGLYQFDHWPIRVEAGGTNHPSNMRPLLIEAHREKTAADNREIGKIRRDPGGRRMNTFGACWRKQQASRSV